MARVTQFNYMALLALLFLTVSIVQSSSFRMDDDEASEELLRTARLDPNGTLGKLWLDMKAVFAKFGISKREHQAEVLNQMLRVAQRSPYPDSMPSFDDEEDLDERTYKYPTMSRKKRQALRAH